MPKGRTIRPIHKNTKTVIAVAAEKLIANTRRLGAIKISDLPDTYSRLINTDGVNEKEVKAAALAAAKLAANEHRQVTLNKQGLTWNNVGRGNRATA